MTAMNLIVQAKAKAAFILTDTAVADNCDGAVAAFIPKVLGLHIGDDAFVAIATSGSWLAGHNFLSHVSAIRSRSLAGCLEALPDAFRKATCNTMSLAAVLAVYDRRANRVCGYTIGSDHSLFPPPSHPYKLRACERHLTDLDPERHWDLIQTDHCDPSQWDPARDGATLLEAQRSDLFQFAPGVFGGGVGGQAILTRVDGSGITHTTIKVWPDRIGRRIDPSAGAQPGWLDRVRAWRLRTFRGPQTIYIR